MNRPLSWLLIVMTLWMSTWLVTDIHVAHARGDHQAHPLFSVAADPAVATDDAPDGDDGSCHFCSYDHGGHVGGMAVPPDYALVLVSAPSSPPRADRFTFVPHTDPPTHRPPIV